MKTHAPKSLRKSTFYSCRGHAAILVILKRLCSINLQSRHWSVFLRWASLRASVGGLPPPPAPAVIVVQPFSRVVPWAAARQASLSSTISQRSPKLTSIESVMPLHLPLPSAPAPDLSHRHGEQYMSTSILCQSRTCH